jgi:hypothetical protein
MTKNDKTQKTEARLPEGDISKLSREEIDRLNYERKLHDQEAAGRKTVTPWHINIVAVAFCAVGLLYAIPRMLWLNEDEASDYIPLSDRGPVEEVEILPPLPRERVYLEDGMDIEISTVTAPFTTTIAATNSDVPNEGQQNYVINDSLTTPQQDIEDLLPESEIINTLEQWAREWSNKNVEGYISHYADTFISENGQNLQAWQEYRRPRISSPEWIEVELGDLEIELTDTNNAQANFIQTYNAPGYSDESFKRLILVRESGGWKINRELSIDI